MPPQLINVKGQTLLLIHKKNDNVINCFIPQRDIKIDDSNYQTYITHVEDYKSYTLLNVKNSSQLVYFDYEELINRI